jgi:hypothetical protein
MLYLEAGNLFLGQQHQGVYWMCTEYRLSVTPEKIVVQDRDNIGHFLQQWAAGAYIYTASIQLCRIAT